VPRVTGVVLRRESMTEQSAILPRIRRKKVRLPSLPAFRAGSEVVPERLVRR